jgi:hypothetical protein
VRRCLRSRATLPDYNACCSLVVPRILRYSPQQVTGATTKRLCSNDRDAIETALETLRFLENGCFDMSTRKVENFVP